MLRNRLLLLAGTAIGLGYALDAKAAPPLPSSWTGFYVGGNAGYSSGSVDTTIAVSPFFYAPFSYNFPGVSGSLPLKPSGAVGGAQAGYNWDFAQRWLIGFEVDLQASGQRDSASNRFAGVNTACTFFTGAFCNFVNTTDVTARLSWFSTSRGRIGFFATSNLLFYGTAGVAVGTVDVSGTNRLTLSSSTGASAAFTTAFNYSATKVGYVAGAGVEGGFGIGGWTWRVEYIHIDLGSIGNAQFGTIPAVTLTTGNFTDDIVRVGFNYRLSARPGP